MQEVIFKDGYYTFLRFSHFPLITAFNNRRLDSKEFLKKLEINFKDLICSEQVHGNEIAIVKRRDKGKIISQKDALITDKKRLPIAIFTADCLSIFLYDPKGGVIALIHAGRRGTEKGITRNTVFKMEREFKSKPKDLKIAFGPAIRNCCYEIDLIRENFNQLIGLGVKKENIFDSEICTSCHNDEFFSYRKEGKSCGRILSVMMLKG